MQKLLLAFLLISSPANAEPTILTGTATKVRDGDTIKIGKIPIRLNGVFAPELKETHGAQSKQFMRELVDGKTVRCVMTGAKTYDRFVGTCYLDGEDIGIAMIAAGMALDCPRYSGGRCVGVEVMFAGRKRIGYAQRLIWERYRILIKH